MKKAAAAYEEIISSGRFSVHSTDHPDMITLTSLFNTALLYNIADNGAIYYKVMPEFQRNYCLTGYFIKGYSPYEKDRLPGTTDDFIYCYGKVLVSYAEVKTETDEFPQDILNKTVNLYEN